MKKWNDEEIQQLKENYPSMTNKELCQLLHITDGQLRSIKSKLGLNSKFKPLTDDERNIIYNYYTNNGNDINLDELSQMIGRPKTSISRWAKEMGLTDPSHNSTDLKKQFAEKIRQYYNSERYTPEKHEAQVKLLSYYAKNNHPKGMLNKHHSEMTRMKMSDSHIKLNKTMSKEERQRIAAKAVQTRMKNNSYSTTTNAYSRCHGGKRKDLNMYFRSSWEANFARILNYLEIQWLYEPKRFVFYNESKGILSYQPDFYLEEYDLWIEIKGWMDDISKKRLYLFDEYYEEEYKKLVIVNEQLYYKMENMYYNKIPYWEPSKKVKKYSIKLEKKEKK